MAWTEEQKVKHLVRLPWTVDVETGDEPNELIVSVREMPAAFGVGTADDKEGLARDFFDSLVATLRTYLHYGDAIPLPAGSEPLPWEQDQIEVVAETLSLSDTQNHAVPPLAVTSSTRVTVPEGSCV